MKLTDDIKSAKWLYFKGAMFLAAGILAAGGILLEHPDVHTVALLAIAIWSFCRFYYFLFYVIERYTDPTFKFAGLYSVFVYIIRSNSRRNLPP